MRRGLIQIDRGLMSHPAFKKEPFTEREAWIWMLMEASYEARQVRVLHNVVELERGQFASAIRFMADRFQWKKDKVARFLKRLVKYCMIETATETGETVVSICNYDVYQSFDLYRETANTTDPRQTRDRPATNYNKIQTPDLTKKDRNKREDSKDAKRGKRLTEDWQPNAKDRQYAEAANWSANEISNDAENFIEYYTNGKGRAETSPNWSRRWQTWVRKNFSRNGNDNTANRRKGLANAFDELEVQGRKPTPGNEGGTGMFGGCVGIDVDPLQSESSHGDAGRDTGALRHPGQLGGNGEVLPGSGGGHTGRPVEEIIETRPVELEVVSQAGGTPSANTGRACQAQGQYRQNTVHENGAGASQKLAGGRG